MSLIPYIFDDFLPYHHDLLGLELYLRDLWTTPAERSLWRSLRTPLGHLKSQLAHQLHIGKDGFEVKLDAENFKPEEITVKAVDNSIIIDAKHEEKKDEVGSVSRHIVRRYVLPKGFKPEQVISNLSSDGLLTIKCPKPETTEGAIVRHIQIQPTGPARLTVGKSSDEEKEEAAKEETEEKTEEKTAEKTDEKK
uniref:Heat shock protein 21.9 n=1 Tax=Sitodiplosis mosellana TaxID=263140 RepID=A0A218KG88_9DIPT|nr:heat shock protein 21.9 [Sitodiplosis mosellana]